MSDPETLKAKCLSLQPSNILSPFCCRYTTHSDRVNVIVGLSNWRWVMRNTTSWLLTLMLLTGATSLFVLGHPAEVRAQSAFCPTDLGKGSVAALKNGACTDGTDGAFSGAALASQALTELSQTTAQETTKNTINAVSTRRAQEEQRCAEGFSRVDGTCQRIPKPVSAPAVSPAPAPSLTEVRSLAAPAVKIVRREPDPPVPIEPAVRFGTWTQVYGDYENRSATGFGATVVGNDVDGTLTNSMDSRTSTVGFLAGVDLTSRGLLFGNDGLIAGVLAGYVSSNLTLNVSSLTNDNINGIPGNGFSRLSANLSGPTAGLYATYFNGGFSTDFTLKVDALTLNETFNELLAFNNGANFPFIPFAGGGSVSLLNTTIAGDLNYRFDLYPIFWFEPTVGAQYTNSSYGSNAAQLGLEDGTLVMVQGGARFGTTTLINNRILMTTTLTGLAYDDVLVEGGFIPAAAFDGANLLARADQGKVRGRGVLALNFDCGQGITSFVQGEVRGGKGLFGAGGKAGVRVQW